MCLSLFTTQEQVEKEKEETLVAERSVLYTLGFDLKATHPYKYLVKVRQHAY